MRAENESGSNKIGVRRMTGKPCSRSARPGSFRRTSRQKPREARAVRNRAGMRVRHAEQVKAERGLKRCPRTAQSSGYRAISPALAATGAALPKTRRANAYRPQAGITDCGAQPVRQRRVAKRRHAPPKSQSPLSRHTGPARNQCALPSFARTGSDTPHFPVAGIKHRSIRPAPARSAF